jgi:Ulp1 family protease
MNPTQQNVQLDAISCLLDSSGTVKDIKLPKKVPQGCGRPRGATNKPKTTTHAPKTTTGATAKPKSTASTTNKPRSTTRDPSAFKYVEKKRKRDAYLANAIKIKKEREEKFWKQDEEEAKKKEQEEALKKQKDSAAPTQTRPV